jgi:hypothetical protein
LCALAFVLKGRLSERFSPSGVPASASSASAASAPFKQTAGSTASSGAGSSGLAAGRESSGAGSVSARWPLYVSSAVVMNREPFDGRALQIEGGYQIGTVSHAVFGLLVDGQRVASISLAELVRMGYSFTYSGTCSGVLRFRELERALTCGKAFEQQSSGRGGALEGSVSITPPRGVAPATAPSGGGLL